MIDLRVLKLDLDRKWSRCAWTAWCVRAAGTLDIVGARVQEVEVRETRKGFHVVLTLSLPLENPVILVALQAMLGSDAYREALNLGRALDPARVEDWNVLFLVKNGHPTKSRMDFGRVLVRALQQQGQKPRLTLPTAWANPQTGRLES